MSESLPTESDLPAALTTRDQWLCWRAEERDGKITKVPVDPNSGSFASTTDSATWSDFETATDRARNRSADGIGFVFTDEDPIVGVDLDDCRIPETGKTREWATDIIDRLESFTEISPSGTGYHVLVDGSLPDDRNRKGDIECYETARFFTVTGDHVDGTPMTVESRTEALEAVHSEYLREDDSEASTEGSNGEKTTIGRTETDATPGSSLSDQDLIKRAKNAANGEKFARLWRGSTAGYESHSEADMALCALLAFWTGGDAAQMDRLFRDSGLCREKWDERHFADGSTYGEKTIERAIAGTDEFYEPTEASERDAPSNQTANTDVGTAPPTATSLRAAQRREADHLRRIEELESKLQNAIDEIDQLETELEAERERRRELKAEFDSKHNTDSSEERSWLPW
jgi:primase-polymerase (primpol)-like protein